MLMGKDMIQKMGFGWIFWSSIFFWHTPQNRQKSMFWLNDQTSRVSNPKVHMTSIITAQLGLCREEFSSSLSRWRAKGEGPWMIPCQWFYTESILQNQPHRGYPSGIKRGQDHVPQHGPRRHLCACNVLRLDPENWVRQKSCRARGAKRALIFLAVKKNRQNDTTPADGNYITRPIVEPQIAFHNWSIQFIFPVLTGLTLRTFPEYSPFAFVHCFNYDHFQWSNRLAAILPNKPRQRPTSQMFSTWGRTKSTSPPGGTWSCQPCSNGDRSWLVTTLEHYVLINPEFWSIRTPKRTKIENVGWSFGYSWMIGWTYFRFHSHCCPSGPCDPCVF
jgi:hypothetical protein